MILNFVHINVVNKQMPSIPLQIQVNVGNILDIAFNVPPLDQLGGSIHGLVGNNDGNASNDFVFRNGTQAKGTNESELYDFGMSCKF